jgi:hypothetical protein
VTIMPRPLPLLTLALLACAGTAGAQTATTAPQPAQPPVTERIESGSDVPATRIEPRNRGTQVIEKRNNGQVTEIEVKSGRSHYHMRPNQPAGNAQAGDAQSSAFRAPQWQVMEFDLNGKKKAAADAEAAAAAAAGAAPAGGSGAAKPVARASATGAPAGKVPAASVPMTRPADVPPPPPMPTTR